MCDPARALCVLLGSRHNAAFGVGVMVYHCGSVLAPHSETILGAVLPGLIPGQVGELRGMVDNFAGATARIVRCQGLTAGISELFLASY